MEELESDPRARYSPLYRMYTLDLPNELSLHIQLHAFREESGLHERIRTESHVAFKVEDIETALRGEEILMPLYEPFDGYRCAIVAVNHQLIELIETGLSDEQIWGEAIFRGGVLYPPRISIDCPSANAGHVLASSANRTGVGSIGASADRMTGRCAGTVEGGVHREPGWPFPSLRRIS
ncbi:hypothetical protein GCM10022287_13060 [Gryllotalpicola koreensis]|uniref:Uncharacterized protein n=1 Tax=Gryllotalpicola koreensis TaxID=993086 RepID=A0ABP7ZX67_9MICO